PDESGLRIDIARLAQRYNGVGVVYETSLGKIERQYRAVDQGLSIALAFGGEPFGTLGLFVVNCIEPILGCAMRRRCTLLGGCRTCRGRAKGRCENFGQVRCGTEIASPAGSISIQQQSQRGTGAVTE